MSIKRETWEKQTFITVFLSVSPYLNATGFKLFLSPCAHILQFSCLPHSQDLSY